MDFKILQETKLDDKSIRIIIETEESDLVYLGYILETMEGWCNYTTISKNPTRIAVDTNIDYLSDLKELLQLLKIWQF